MEKRGFWESLKGQFNLKGILPTNSKGLNLAITIGLAGLIFLLTFNRTKGPNQPSPLLGGEEYPRQSSLEDSLTKKEEELAKSLAKVLSCVQGVGRVEVVLTLDSGPRQIYETNTREEVSGLEELDSNGGTRKQVDYHLEETLVLLRNTQGQEKALVNKEIQAEVRGVLVVAEGAGNGQIMANIARATSKVLGIPLHKVVVLPY